MKYGQLNSAKIAFYLWIYMMLNVSMLYMNTIFTNFRNYNNTMNFFHKLIDMNSIQGRRSWWFDPNIQSSEWHAKNDLWGLFLGGTDWSTGRPHALFSGRGSIYFILSLFFDWHKMLHTWTFLITDTLIFNSTKSA